MRSEPSNLIEAVETAANLTRVCNAFNNVGIRRNQSQGFQNNRNFNDGRKFQNYFHRNPNNRNFQNNKNFRSNGRQFQRNFKTPNNFQEKSYI